MSDRYAALKARALAALDDNDGDRGDVAEPATHMPRSLASRCMSCGKDMSVRNKSTEFCDDHEMKDDALSSPAPHTVQRPGGGITKPRPPMTKDGSQGHPVEMGGPGSGPHAGSGKPKGLLATIKGGLKAYGKAIVNQYHIPKADSKGNRPEDRDVRGPINDTAKSRDPWD